MRGKQPALICGPSEDLRPWVFYLTGIEARGGVEFFPRVQRVAQATRLIEKANPDWKEVGGFPAASVPTEAGIQIRRLICGYLPPQV